MNTCVKPEWNWVCGVGKCHLGSIQFPKPLLSTTVFRFNKMLPFSTALYFLSYYSLVHVIRIGTGGWYRQNENNCSPLMQTVVYITQLSKAQSYGSHFLLSRILSCEGKQYLNNFKIAVHELNKKLLNLHCLWGWKVERGPASVQSHGAVQRISGREGRSPPLSASPPRSLSSGFRLACHRRTTRNDRVIQK